MPFALPAKERGFVLHARNGYPKLFVIVDAERRARKVRELPADGFAGDRSGFHLSGFAGLDSIRQKLQRTDAIAPDGEQQVIGVNAVCTAARRDASTSVTGGGSPCSHRRSSA